MANGVEEGLLSILFILSREVEILSPRMEDFEYPATLVGPDRVFRFSRPLPLLLVLKGEGDATRELASEGSTLLVVGCMEGHC